MREVPASATVRHVSSSSAGPNRWAGGAGRGATGRATVGGADRTATDGAGRAGGAAEVAGGAASSATSGRATASAARW